MGIRKVYTKEELVAKAINNPNAYNRERARKAIAKDLARKEIKEDFEKYLDEEMKKYSLGFNPYQE